MLDRLLAVFRRKPDVDSSLGARVEAHRAHTADVVSRVDRLIGQAAQDRMNRNYRDRMASIRGRRS